MVAPFADKSAAELRPLNVDNWTARFPRLRAMFEAYPPRSRAPCSPSTLYGYVSCPRWAVGNVAIIGDAAHGLPPTLGQGGGPTLMNAYALSTILHDDTKDAPQALLEWERRVRFISDRTHAPGRAATTASRAACPSQLNFLRPAMVWSFATFKFRQELYAHRRSWPQARGHPGQVEPAA